MRATGKTTLLIDRAIQELFTKGEIWVPRKHQIKERWRGYSEEHIKRMTEFVDPDHEPGNECQAYFITRLQNRLFNEHSGRFTITGHVYKRIG